MRRLFCPVVAPGIGETCLVGIEGIGTASPAARGMPQPHIVADLVRDDKREGLREARP